MQQGMLYHTLRDPDSGCTTSRWCSSWKARWTWRLYPGLAAGAASSFGIAEPSCGKGVPQMLQMVYRQQELPFGCRDWRDRSVAAAAAGLEAHLASCRSAGFDWKQVHCGEWS